ncbi:MAG: hypothetical protein ACYTFW_00170 [Planctomycetota bacterium]|jgi:hypothetical protein
MISKKLWEQIQKEGKESGFGIAKIDFPSEEHNNQCVIYLKRTPEFYTMKEEREEERKRAEQKRENLRCKVGLHRWGSWDDPCVVLDYQAQLRCCEQCGVYESRRV